MITIDDVIRTTKDTDAKGFSLCFHCNKEIKKMTYSMQISLCKDHNQIIRKGMYQYVEFHINCWKEIAGEEYMFSDDR